MTQLALVYRIVLENFIFHKDQVALCGPGSVATGWTVRVSNLVGGGIFRFRPDRPWGLPGLLYNRYRVFFRGVKWPRRALDHAPPRLAPSLKKEYNYTSTPPLEFHGLLKGELYLQGYSLSKCDTYLVVKHINCIL